MWPLGRTTKSWCVPITVTLHSAQVAAARAVLSWADGHLPDDIVAEVDLLDHGVGSVWARAAVIDQEMSVG